MTTEQAQRLREQIALKLGWTFNDVQNHDATTEGPEDYLTDANAALLLVEHMRKEGWSVVWYYDKVKKKEAINFTKMGVGTFWEFATTLPITICLAFAKATGINLSTPETT